MRDLLADIIACLCLCIILYGGLLLATPAVAP